MIPADLSSSEKPKSTVGGRFDTIPLAVHSPFTFDALTPDSETGPLNVLHVSMSPFLEYRLD